MAINFNEFVPEEEKVLIIDALNLAFRWKHQGVKEFVQDYAKTVQSFAKSYNCSKVIIAADKGSSEYRKRILPEYKQNRKEKYAQQTEEEAVAFQEFFLEYERTLNYLRTVYTVIQRQGVEADDLAAHVVKHKEKYGFESIVLVSSDKDWDLLVQKNVIRFSYITRKETALDNWEDHYDISPEQLACYKCLIGDKGDNVPGFTGIGPKRATDLLREFGSAYNIYDNVPIDSKYKYIQEINQNPDKILKNYELMDLLTHCDDAIGVDELQELMY